MSKALTNVRTGRIIDTGLVVSFFATLFYSNLVSRIFGEPAVNLAFYAILGLSFARAVLYLRPTELHVAHWLVTGLFVAFVADSRYPLEANLWSLRDFVVPLLCFSLGATLMSRNLSVTANCLNYLYTPFLAYGVVQEALFYSGGLSALPSWDAQTIENALASGESTNVVMGSLMRFFGTMNSFVEYQVCAVVIGLFLWLQMERIRHKFLGVANICLMFVFLILSIERAPMAMLLITLLIWKIPKLFQRMGWLLPVSAAAVVLVGGVVAEFGETLKQSPLVGEQYQRLVNVMTLHLKDDEAVNMREDLEWRIALDLARTHFFGLGPGKVSPGARDVGDYLAPHNNFLAVHLGYGVIGLAAFLGFLAFVLISVWRIGSDGRWFALGLTAAYCGMALFNMPFIGKQGEVFFLVLGVLSSLRGARAPARCIGSGTEFCLETFAETHVSGATSPCCDIPTGLE